MQVTITSAIPLMQEDKQIIVHFLTEKTKMTVHADYQTDPTLIAGIRVKSQNYLWEKSVARLLRDIKLHNVQ